MNIKKIFIGLITSVALVFTVALALPSNTTSFINTNKTNMSTRKAPPITNWDGNYVDDTVVAPSKLPATFTKQNLGEYEIYNSDLSQKVLDEDGELIQSDSLNLSITFAGLQYFSDDSYFKIGKVKNQGGLFDSENSENRYDMFIAFTVYEEATLSGSTSYNSSSKGTYEKEEYNNATLDKGIYLMYVDYAWESDNTITDTTFNIVRINISKYDFEKGTLIDKEFRSIYQDTSDIVDQIGEGTFDYFAESISLELNFINEMHKPGISYETTIINDIDNPFTLEQIKEIADIKIMDDYYGDLSGTEEIVKENYTQNNNKIGEFEIEFYVENPAGLGTSFVIIISNRDFVAPVINGPGTSTISYTEQFNIDNLTAQITVRDNSGETIKLVKTEDNFVQGVPGVYTFKFSATDKSGNSSTFVHTLTVIDDVKAIFTDEIEGVIQVNWKDIITDNMLLVGLTAWDAISEDLTSKIKVVENNISKELGKHTVKYSVTDNAGNIAQYSRTYEVVTTDAPIFYVSKNLIIISDANRLTNEQLIQEMARYHNIKVASYSFITNDYEENFNMAGEYEVQVAINDVNGTEHIISRTMRVLASKDVPAEQLTLWQKIVKFFKDAWNWIKEAAKTVWGWITYLPKKIIGWFSKKSLVLFLSL